MGVSFQEIKNHLDSRGINYVNLGVDRIGLGVKTEHTNLHFVLTREEDGEYLRLRSLRYLTCPKEHPAVTDVHKKLVGFNYDFKLIKFGWDEADGEIVGEVALPLEDATLADEQLMAMLALLTRRCNEQYPEINALIESGGAGRRSPPALQPRKEEPKPAGIPQPSTSSVVPRASGAAIPAKTSDPARLVFAIGIVIIGLAALGAVAYLFLR
jgi:hypothetical protein